MPAGMLCPRDMMGEVEASNSAGKGRPRKSVGSSRLSKDAATYESTSRIVLGELEVGGKRAGRFLSEGRRAATVKKSVWKHRSMERRR